MNSPAVIGEIWLHPGELFFGAGRARVHTVLGSCVAVVLWHPWRRIGGMCHYMLPHRSEAGPERTDRAAVAARAPDGKYGEEALDMLEQEIRDVGTRPSEYVVKIFGGGNMLPRERLLPPARSVAVANVETARAWTLSHGLSVQVEHVHGVGHRRLIFDLGSGNVWLRHSTETLLQPKTVVGASR